VIVVVGLPAYADSPDGEKCAGGLAVEVAAAARARGSSVELVGKVGNDGAGDAVVVALGRLGVGHSALLRDPALPTPVLAAAAVDDDAAELDADGPEARLLPEDAAARPSLDAADIDLALKFLPGAGVIVLAEPLPDAAVAVTVEAAAFAGARLIVLVPSGAIPPAVPAGATVLEAPPDDDGSFGRLVGTFAGALDAGVEPATAFAEAVAASGWEPIAG
jgi:sugar/nucleoside kinase (ribokinase family)